MVRNMKLIPAVKDVLLVIFTFHLVILNEDY
jgi:cell division protein FtsB